MPVLNDTTNFNCLGEKNAIVVKLGQHSSPPWSHWVRSDADNKIIYAIHYCHIKLSVLRRIALLVSKNRMYHDKQQLGLILLPQCCEGMAILLIIYTLKNQAIKTGLSWFTAKI